MTDISNIQLGNTSNIVLYADDIGLTVAAARPRTAHSGIEIYLDSLKAWAKAYELEFSPTKSQLLSLKGGLMPGYSVGFGSGENDARIVAEVTAKYLGVILDPRESFWDHVSSLKTKSEGMYRRLRQMTSANWGMGRAAAKVIYEVVFLPRITYAAEIWAEGGCTLKKSIAALGSMQREPLRAITSSYKTASTNCLSVVAGVLPLDLEVRRVEQKCRIRAGGITSEEYNLGLSALMEEWLVRYDAVDKGEWTKFMIPDVARRCGLTLELDHYTTQFLTGHRDFRSKLYSFKLQPNPNCVCGNGAETVRHVLLTCTRTRGFREKLIAAMTEEGVAWPPESGAFLSTRKTYEALKRFSKNSLQNRTDR
ncbi:unnamed protein product [Macrosiphum euphorbiae]|uniref:Reverse transcriptase domain-containing protein n=1 Tax=Macrosiphum euphorbiae TaxID=13131 RepID=A0AAV0WW41_9HEMI|nr:unnamed protein product [Macrosiphum euphorbiae]